MFSDVFSSCHQELLLTSVNCSTYLFPPVFRFFLLVLHFSLKILNIHPQLPSLPVPQPTHHNAQVA